MGNMNTEIPKAYDPKVWEDDLYRKWEESGFFNPDNLPGDRTRTFCTIMPPPNANGRLHVGHGLDMTLKDLMIRYKRMSGWRTLWVPGADHAGFETQIVYERRLEQEGRTRFEMDPTELYDNILKFTLENKHFMENDVRRMGASCDWSREKFTLDPDVVSQVQKTFEKMHRDGLVYRGSRIVNWCPKHQTSLSDVETEFKEQSDPFYYFQYGPFVIGTSRPETKFGDKYVVMHPDDERYKEYEDGQQFELEWINGKITATVIKDAAIDMSFGSGVMTITPWHDPIDFDIAQRHDLDTDQVIDFDGKLLPIAGEFAGMPILEARAKIIEKLEKKGLVVRVDTDYKHSVKVCYKCGTSIEPQIKEQWFVKMKPLAEMAMKPVREGKIVFMPKRFEKIFFHWMTNTIDWNISRQIVWGIPIPAKICQDCHEGFPDLDDTAEECRRCGSANLLKDTDTFDTWFSSGQWPLLALGYPDHRDFDTYYPTDVMETGADLVFKWIPRMIMFGMYLTGREPFRIVYFHGMVNDEHNQKMSKSKGNVISPVELSERFGTDAMRMALVIGNGPGNNIPLSHEKVESYRNFTNKLWNIGRYVGSQSANDNRQSTGKPEAKSDADRWILKRLSETVESVTDHLDRYKFSLAGEILRDFTWDDFADWYVEVHKIEKNDVLLRHAFDTILTLWHPFMPFVTEAIHQTLHLDRSEFLMIAEWPAFPSTHETIADENRFELVKDLIVKIRNIRSVYHIDPAVKIIVSARDASERTIRNNEEVFKWLARVSEVRTADADIPDHTLLIQSGLLQAFLHLDGAIDIEKEKARIGKELAETERYATSLEAKLANPSFTDRAPKELVEQTKTTLDTARAKTEELRAHLSSLG